MLAVQAGLTSHVVAAAFVEFFVAVLFIHLGLWKARQVEQHRFVASGAPVPRIFYKFPSALRVRRVAKLSECRGCCSRQRSSKYLD